MNSLKLTCFFFFVFSFLLTGCNPFHTDPETTVTLTISPVSKSKDRDEILEILSGLTDKPNHTMSVRMDGETMHITLSPVRDVQAFARQINFGQVQEVKDRSIIIEYVKHKEYI